MHSSGEYLGLISMNNWKLLNKDPTSWSSFSSVIHQPLSISLLVAWCLTFLLFLSSLVLITFLFKWISRNGREIDTVRFSCFVCEGKAFPLFDSWGLVLLGVQQRAFLRHRKHAVCRRRFIVCQVWLLLYILV